MHIWFFVPHVCLLMSGWRVSVLHAWPISTSICFARECLIYEINVLQWLNSESWLATCIELKVKDMCFNCIVLHISLQVAGEGSLSFKIWQTLYLVAARFIVVLSVKRSPQYLKSTHTFEALHTECLVWNYILGMAKVLRKHVFLENNHKVARKKPAFNVSYSIICLPCYANHWRTYALAFLLNELVKTINFVIRSHYVRKKLVSSISYRSASK